MSNTEKKRSAAPPAASIDAKLLHKIQTGTFGPRDWRCLAQASLRARTRRALGHLTRITPRLVRQLADLPPALSRPRVLNVLNRLRLSPGRWSMLRAALADAGPQRRAMLNCLAGKINSPGDFWDYWREAVEDSARAFTLPAGAFVSVLLEPLPDPAALRAEGRRMANCLASLASHIRAGRAIYFRPRNLALVTAELLAYGAAWRVGHILGPGNINLGPEEAEPIHIELQRLADHLNQCAPPVADELDSTSIREIRAWARAHYSEATIARVAQPLCDIRGRSLEAQRGAFAIFAMETGVYVQLLAGRGDMGFLCEVSSHKYVPFMHTRLSEPVVALLEQARFIWPTGEQNFHRRFLAASDQDIVALAELALAMLGRMGGLRPGATLTRKGHIPRERAPQTLPPAWSLVDDGLDLEDEVTVQPCTTNASSTP